MAMMMMMMMLAMLFMSADCLGIYKCGEIHVTIMS
jgi:hypothetical protein